MSGIKRTPTIWLLGLVTGASLAVAAVCLIERDTSLSAAQARDARELSSVFRQVSSVALPSIVSIETRGKPVRVPDNLRRFFDDENSPFGELFRNDPRFRNFRQQPERESRPRGQGSGFVIDPSGIAITNAHVVRDAETVKVQLHDGREFIATGWKTDPRSDIAIVRFDGPSDLRAIEFGDSDVMEIGDWVLAVGSPFGFDMTVTAGIISGKKRGLGLNGRENFLQTDAAINPGNSGGPLLNLNGEVIGVNTAISTRSGGYDGVGFAIPINMTKWVIQQLVEKGEVSRAYLGVGIARIDKRVAAHLKLGIDEGAEVKQVFPKSPAAEAGLETGDIILELDGKKVNSPSNLQGIVEKLEIDGDYKMSVLRDGKRTTIPITVRAMPKNFETADSRRPTDEPDSESGERISELGIEIQKLTPEIANQFQGDIESGVVITSVDSESPAGDAGLRPGLVIDKVGEFKVGSPQEFRDAIAKTSLRDGVLLRVHGPRGSSLILIQAE